MTNEQKRMHFAGLALVGMGCWCPMVQVEEGRFGMLNLDDSRAIEARARWAVAQADAMLKALEE